MAIKNSILKSAVLISVIISAILIIVVLSMLSGADSQRIWRSVLINYLYFTPLAAGLVVWPAIVIITGGKWMGNLEKICLTGISFSFPSIIILIVLWINSGEWAPWIGAEPQKIWLNNTFLFTRNMILLFTFWILVFIFLKNRYEKNNKILAGWLIFVYAVTFSITGFDFVMALDRGWYSMMIGGYFFISGLYCAAAAWAFLSIFIERPADVEILHDIGKLIITFCMLTSYLMFSQLLPIWYENLPEETTFLIPRMNLAWKGISYALLALVYLGPVILLLNSRLKQNRIYMASVSFLILTGMWIERWWLVSAVFEKNKVLFGFQEIIPALAFAFIMLTGILIVIRSRHEFAQQKIINNG